MQERAAELWYDVTYWVTATVFTLGFSLRAEGGRNVPLSGPALLIANHQSYLDPVLVGLAARRHLCYLARKTLFDNPLFAALIRSYHAVPIDQEGFAREGLRVILDQLKAGKAVLVFPEGERTGDGAVYPLRPGVHLLIKKGQVPVVPVGIAGAFEAWPRWRPCPVPAPLFLPPGKGTIAVAVGKPMPPQRFEGLPRERVLDELFGQLKTIQARAERLRRKT
jgi:1-acyl-sn-glycerol-3-phosphate acyltransferase